jgi:putative ABC transport system ATP-binding protein
VTLAEQQTIPSADATTPAVAIRDLTFAYRPPARVLDIRAFDIARRERVFVFGPSGSGKTTLLGILAGVLKADGGSVRVLGTELAALSGGRRDAFRAVHIGYIFQMFNLIPYLSVLDNITLPCRLSAARRARLNGGSVDDAARDLMARLGIAAFAEKKVTELSVGQQQRVAAARALIGSPELIIADEPTSALDTDRREQFLELLFDCCARARSTLVFVSHDRTLVHLFDRTISLPEINAVAESAPPFTQRAQS